MPGRPPAHPGRAPSGVLVRALALLLAAVALALPGAVPAAAESYVPVSGAGSTWSQNALDQWRANVKQYGMTVNYSGTGSSDGRNQFRNGTVDFAVSEIPYGIKDSGVVDPAPSRKFSYMPIVAGGTAFMYNLKIGNRRITNLRLSGEVVAKIFTGVITTWNDPAIKADNPALASSLPARKIVPVVRSDGSGTTAQLTSWLSNQHQGLWDAYCAKAGRSTPCGQTSNYPVVAGRGFVGQSGSNGVSGYVAQDGNQGTITYVEYSYAVATTGFPVAKILNKAGYYTEPTAQNVAVSLTKAAIRADLTQDLSQVYNEAADRRNYPLSSYSYMIVPTAQEANFNPQKGKALGAFAYYFLCEGQRSVDRLGYSPLPVNLVQAGLEQVRRIPGVVAANIDLKNCKNPTFSADGTNTLATTAPQPSECDKQGATQCEIGTGGNKAPTQTGSASGGAASGSGGSGGSGGTGGSATGGGAAAGGSGSGGAGGSGGAAPTGGGAGGSASGGGDGSAADGGSGAVDPETGRPLAAGAGDLFGIPVTTASGIGGLLQTALMVLGALILLTLTVGPPLLTRQLARRRAGGGS
ncbi:phosphate ABC transporter substrate-binding protein PstS [Streptomyces sp. NBC_00555]|uniref:phosphate ABC transporter substrate-binding protein PstS n=1 Tax=Streptomyces sp. NBC_00555 TaxID=2903662 RepID=UPI00225AC5BA|nr:phosphate ABC transporter substrate-binding protein PstS [Streptomyces sp. NBC_00555]MCX5013875.1 phosphate ABC transporter substrate-binding protein PstS [Streptomyces sp. NBC_00555]